MESSVQKRIVVVFSPEEAEWLAAVVQNPLCEEETGFDCEMRNKLWTVLTQK